MANFKTDTVSIEQLTYAELRDENYKLYKYIESVNSQINSKDKIEFNRYKQDCRKRALDLAHSENTSALLRTASTLNQGQLGNHGINIISKADEYYKWLIEIPKE